MAFEEPVALIKLTDINIDCLETIFKYLQFDDLLNIAHTNKALKAAADLAFASKFRNRKFILELSAAQSVKVYQQATQIYVYDLGKCLQLLRCFGHFIRTISINFSSNWKYVLSYINEYCVESLQQMDFNLNEHIAFNLSQNLRTPFANVGNVHFCNWPASSLEQIQIVFPNVRQLSIENCQLISPIAINLPHLEHLVMNVSQSDVRPFLRSNLQMRRLTLIENLALHSPDIGVWFGLQETIQQFEHLEHLEMMGCPLAALDFYSFIQLRHLKCLNIRFAYGEYYSYPLETLPFVCERLEEFGIDMDDLQVMDTVINFISRHSTIRKLTIKSKHFKKILDDEMKMAIAKSLPLLREVEFCNFYKYFSAFNPSSDEIDRFIGECKFLSKFSFTAAPPFKVQPLRSRLGTEWTVLKGNGYVKVERKSMKIQWIVRI